MLVRISSFKSLAVSKVLNGTTLGSSRALSLTRFLGMAWTARSCGCSLTGVNGGLTPRLSMASFLLTSEYTFERGHEKRL